MRPENSTEEDLIKWDKQLEDTPAMPTLMKQIPFMKEVFRSGCWLIESLAKAGVPEEEAMKICLDHGKNAVECRDSEAELWSMTKETLEGYGK